MDEDDILVIENQIDVVNGWNTELRVNYIELMEMSSHLSNRASSFGPDDDHLWQLPLQKGRCVIPTFRY